MKLDRLSLIVALPLILGTLTLGGCAAPSAVRVSYLGTEHYSPASSIVTLSSFPASTKYETLARLHIVGAAGQDRAQLMAALLKKAANLGANAFVVTRESYRNLTSGAPATFNPNGGNYQTATPERELTIEGDAIRLH
ncbi:MAG: hypothetical protein PHO57_11365 [Acidithiobacillus sp.]|nr:hypothetical protein [Acidithiobacillus sp.]